MKKISKIFAALVLVSIVGCAGVKTYKTLGTLEAAANSSYQTYNRLVVSGQVSTNDLPTVAQAYKAFQSTMTQAIIFAQSNTNAPASDEVVNAANTLATTIATASIKK